MAYADYDDDNELDDYLNETFRPYDYFFEEDSEDDDEMDDDDLEDEEMDDILGWEDE